MPVLISSILCVLGCAAVGAAGPPCIPFDHSNNQVSVSARVNGHDGVWLTLDTGSQGSLLDEGKVAELGLVTVGRQQSLGAGGLQEGSSVRDVDVELPGFTLPDLTMDTLALGMLSAAGGRMMDGILGHELFSRRVVKIDYARRCLELSETGGFDPNGPGVVPIELLEDHPYVSASVVFPGGRTIVGKFVIDTGASSGLILSSEALDRDVVETSMDRSLPAQGRGVGGGVEMRLTRIERLDIGSFALARPIVVLQPSGAGRISAPGTLGNIGGAILSRFTVTFDYARRLMKVEPGPDFEKPFEGDMSGLILIANPPDYRTMSVARVLPGSPASDAGARIGDVVETVNGTPAATFGLQALRELFRQEGRSVTLVLRRGAERLTITLNTRRLI